MISAHAIVDGLLWGAGFTLGIVTGFHILRGIGLL